MHVIIVGAGLLGRKLAKGLAENGHDVVVVEEDRQRCEDVRAESGALVINGSPERPAVLEEAGIDRADTLVAVLPKDLENVAVCVIGKRYKVPKIVAKIVDPDYDEVFRLAGAHHVEGWADILYNEMMLEIEEPTVRRVASLARGAAELLIVKVPEGSSITGKNVSELAAQEDFPEGFLFVAVIREGKVIITHGKTKIQAGDDVVVVATAEDVPRIGKLVG